jgi:hypothetical protein
LAGCSEQALPAVSDPGPGCTDNPLACPSGTTCWPADSSGKFDCLPAPAAQTDGAACIIRLARPDCAEGLFCYPTEPASGYCSPFCVDGKCPSGAACNGVFVNEVKYRYDVRVCALTPLDAGAD